MAAALDPGVQAHALSLLRESDRDRYLACLLTPESRRASVAALYAFNAEIARVRDSVRDALPGEMRLQYWRDLVEGTHHGETAANPVASGLLAAIEAYRLPRPVLSNMIDARIFDLYDDPMESRSSLEGYAGETASALIQLVSLILDPQAAAASATRAGHAGVAQAIAGMLLLMPKHRARGQIYVPAEILAATGLDGPSFLSVSDAGRVGAAIEAFAGLGLDHLAKARGEGPLPASLVPAFLPVGFAGPVLRSARKLGAGILTRDLQPSQWRRQWWMMRMLASRRL